MAKTMNVVVKSGHCAVRNQNAQLIHQVVYPADVLLHVQGPRVLSRRCSLDMECNRMDTVACVWAGTNPNVDPLLKP